MTPNRQTMKREHGHLRATSYPWSRQGHRTGTALAVSDLNISFFVFGTTLHWAYKSLVLATLQFHTVSRSHAPPSWWPWMVRMALGKIWVEGVTGFIAMFRCAKAGVQEGHWRGGFSHAYFMLFFPWPLFLIFWWIRPACAPPLSFFSGTRHCSLTSAVPLCAHTMAERLVLASSVDRQERLKLKRIVPFFVLYIQRNNVPEDHGYQHCQAKPTSSWCDGNWLAILLGSCRMEDCSKCSRPAHAHKWRGRERERERQRRI